MSQDLRNRSLVAVRPDLAEEWDVDKNGDLTPDSVTAGSHRKVWWKCAMGEDHRWLAEVKSRVQGNGCPFCAGQKVGQDNNLAVRFPELVPQWHLDKNGDLRPDQVMPGSDRKVWWQCSKGHEWTASIGNRTRGYGCPFCSGTYATKNNNLARTNPKLASEWHPDKNGDLTPYDILPKSNRKFWWKCDQGHEWLATANNRMRGYGCPYCAGRMPTPENNLAIRNPKLAAEWDVSRNGELTAYHVLPNASQKVWWKCSKGHNSYLASPNNRNNGKTGCPECAGKIVNEENNLAIRYPELVEEWDAEKNGDLGPRSVMPGSYKKVWWKCNKGHDSYLASPNARTSNKTGCPLCKLQTSKPEFRLFCELSFVFPEAEWQKRIGKISCDVYLPRDSLAIEYDGLHWHRNTADKDRNKEERLRKRGVTLFRLREYGLKAISDLDVVICEGEPFLDSIKRLFVMLSDRGFVSTDERSRYQIYLDSPDFLQTRQYAAMVHTLSIPRFEESVAAHPILVHEWDYDRNGTRKPYMFALGSGEKVWWQCSKGHCWEATINHRTGSKTGCPECAGQRAGVDNNLAIKFPELALEWNAAKNGSLVPANVTTGSGQRVWWKCHSGHEWLATVSSRVRGNGCPFCSGRNATETNNLAARAPELVMEWDFDRNGKLTPDKVTPCSNKKVFWICSKGHTWSASPGSRTTSNCGCPECGGKKVGKDNNLAARFPELVSEWDVEKNGELTPDRVMPGSSRKVWWRCRSDKGHEWQATIASRTAGKGCPRCNREKQRTRKRATAGHNLAIKHPELCLEWHAEKNGNLTGHDVTPGTHRKVWWKCKNGHDWMATVNSRVKGNGCPVCAGQVATPDDNLLMKCPLIAREWHPSLNGELLPSDVKSQSGKNVWWKCSHGHEWQARIQSRVKGSGRCPYCKRQSGTDIG